MQHLRPDDEGIHLDTSKAAIRARMRAMRRALDPAWRKEASQAICRRLATVWREAGHPPVCGYCATAGEPDVCPFLEAVLARSGPVLLPRVGPDGQALELRAVTSLASLLPGFRGILEPDPTRCALAEPAPRLVVVVPGLAFDESGGRLGQGGGHYDRLLQRLGGRAIAVGVCWQDQVLPGLPLASNDRRMQALVTEERATFLPGFLAP